MPTASSPCATRSAHDPPAGVGALSDGELADLVAAIGAADSEQSRALDDAIGHTLRFLPWPLNPIVKRILIG